MATSPPSLTAPPTAPTQADPTTFPSRAEALVAWQSTNVTEMTAAMENVYANANEAASVAAPVLMTFDNPTTIADPGNGKFLFNNATLSSVTSIAVDLLDNGGNDLTTLWAALAASTSAIKGYLTFRQGVSGKYAVYAVTAMTSPSGYRQFTVSFIAGSSGGFTDDAVTAVGIVRNGDTGTPAMTYAAIAANTGILAAYSGYLLDIISGSGSVSIQTPAALGANFWALLRNSTNNVLTLSPADGVSTPTLRPGDLFLWQSDGSNYHYIPLKRGNWRLWATTTVSTPVASVAFTSLPQTARNLALEIKGASHNNGSNTTLGVSFMVDGATYSGPYLPSDSVAAAATVSGKVLVPHFVSNNLVITGGAFSSAQAGATHVLPNNSATLTAIRAQFAAGSIDAGTFELWVED